MGGMRALTASQLTFESHSYWKLTILKWVLTVQTRNKRPKKRVWNEHKKIAHTRLRL